MHWNVNIERSRHGTFVPLSFADVDLFTRQKRNEVLMATNNLRGQVVKAFNLLLFNAASNLVTPMWIQLGTSRHLNHACFERFPRFQQLALMEIYVARPSINERALLEAGTQAHK